MTKTFDVSEEHDSVPVLTAEMVAREMKRVGEQLTSARAFVDVATRDAIRHWAEGIGDRNPLWSDEDYASRTQWQGLIAPPTIVLAMSRAILSTAARGFPGLHGWHLGNEFEFHRPVRVDMGLDGRSLMERISPVTSNYAGGTAYDQTIRTELTDRATGESVCSARTFIRRWDRAMARKTAKYGETRQRHHYTPEELEGVMDAYDQEMRDLRGASPRYVEDVRLGQELPDLLRGPLTAMDCIAFVRGWGGSFVFAHGFAWDYFREHSRAFPRNESGVPDSPERTHWEDEFARAVGAPASFDYGPQRIAWAGTHLTNWSGDDGPLTRLRVRITRPNYRGDTVKISGRIVGVDAATGEVEIASEAVNQLGETVMDAVGVVRLPHRNPAADEQPQ